MECDKVGSAIPKFQSPPRRLTAPIPDPPRGGDLETKNSFELIQPVTDMECDKVDSPDLSPVVNYQKIPITVQMNDKLDLNETLKNLNNLLTQPIKGRINKFNNLTIIPKTAPDFQATVKYLKDNELPFFTFSQKNSRPRKFVIKGLTKTTSCEDITEAMNSFGFACSTVFQFKSRGKPLPIFCFTIIPNCKININEIYKIDSLLFLKIKIEKFRSKRPKQCFRCQHYFHSSQNCNFPAVCVKCAGDHLSSDCPHDKTTVPTCANCQGAHTANFSRCPKNPRFFKPKDRNSKPNSAKRPRNADQFTPKNSGKPDSFPDDTYVTDFDSAKNAFNEKEFFKIFNIAVKLKRATADRRKMISQVMEMISLFLE
ncbi:hypothetical protein CDL12_30490 [Handroanthus impetiginosus]|uniref:Nucleic-acid-binding protein from transposon X-element n=1 Tax=Handroanthus impetiginosus TaxID=429701 RepID=A0A2G9FVC1_9LAMI|nr:hypothetical protein CDL12_30490 [Handroanthus impetiginosus]